MDAFDLLGLPRQPWLDPAAVRAAFQSRARTVHPDAAGGSAAEFARLNAAYREVERPATRLRLLVGGTEIPTVPPDIELGFRVGAFLRECDEALAKWRAAASPLGRALLAGEVQRVRETLAGLQSAVAEHRAAAERKLRDVSMQDGPALAVLAGEFTFLDRWTAQLRERALEFEVVGDGAPPSNHGRAAPRCRPSRE